MRCHVLMVPIIISAFFGALECASDVLTPKEDAMDDQSTDLE
jgi:hypothetical protein